MGALPFAVHTPALGLALALIAFAILLYRRLLPKPIPGIPYNRSSARSLAGDIPRMLKYVESTQEVISFFTSQCIELNSPVVQLFIRPLGPPMVFVADWRESLDILSRRTKEFDRSEYFGEVLKGLLPKAFITRQTDDIYRHQRRKLANTMSNAFLNQVVAPRVYEATQSLLDLWRVKRQLAGHHPFEAPTDIHQMALDSIWAATFGEAVGTTASQVRLLNGLSRLDDLSANEDEAAVFPKAPAPREFAAVGVMTQSLDNAIASPLPTWHHWMIRQGRAYREAKKIKDDTFDRQFKKAQKAYTDDFEDQRDITSAVENVMQREVITAKKEGREPQLDNDTVKDDLFAFLIGGHETISTTMTWAVKYLADDPIVQNKLRASLRAEFATAASTQTDPSADAIISAAAPYLDAVIEETLRCSALSHGAIRNTKCDTEILGHFIPKGTDVYMVSNGPDFFTPGFKVDEARRHPSSQSHGDKAGAWTPDHTMRNFVPERWLKPASSAESNADKDSEGNVRFDVKAGPQLVFGQGPRSCFGKKLAYMNLRIMVTLIIWNFELRPCPPELAGNAGLDLFTHRPRKCFVRLEPLTPLH